MFKYQFSLYIYIPPLSSLRGHICGFFTCTYHLATEWSAQTMDSTHFSQWCFRSGCWQSIPNRLFQLKFCPVKPLQDSLNPACTRARVAPTILAPTLSGRQVLPLAFLSLSFRKNLHFQTSISECEVWWLSLCPLCFTKKQCGKITFHTLKSLSEKCTLGPIPLTVA